MGDDFPGSSIERLMAGGIRQGPTALQVLGLRLSQRDHSVLALLADMSHVPKATFARNLMKAAISDAVHAAEFDTPEENTEFEFRMQYIQDEQEARDMYLSLSSQDQARADMYDDLANQEEGS